jgi:hypothetical protein
VKKRLERRRNVARKRNAFNVKRPKDLTRKWKGNGNEEIDEQPGTGFPRYSLGLRPENIPWITKDYCL